jgi:hypothetical protein
LGRPTSPILEGSYVSRRKDDAVMGLFSLIVVAVELAWLGVLAYWLFRLLRAVIPPLRY